VPSPRQKKGKLSKKKTGRAESEARYRPRRYSSTPPTIGGTVPSGFTSFPKKKVKFKIEKEVARRTRTQKIMKLNKQELLQKKTVIGLTGRLPPRSPADRLLNPNKKKTFCLKRRAGFAKTKIFFYHPGLDGHGAVDVSGDLDVPWGLPRPTVDDEIRAWNLTPHSGVWFFTNLPSGIRKSAPRRLGLDFLDSSSSLTLFGPSTSPHPFSRRSTTRRFSPFHSPAPI
jgi:hypothetical protein